MVSDVQVSRESEAQVSASMVKAKNHRVTISQAGRKIWGPGAAMKIHRMSISRAAKIMKIGPKATQNNETWTLES